jgi:nitroimidazol reductase NimA-like FMN-containing flavoprotein (pyridoxamine 5'-phosphate oxidase superfamily)
MAYHIRRTDREIKDPPELEQVIKQGRYATIALCKNNRPYIVTLSYGYDSKNKALYFHGANKGRKIDYIKANPQAYLTIIDHKGFIENECDHSYRSVVLKGKIELLEKDEDRVQAVKVLIDSFEKNPQKMMNKINTGSNTWVNTAIFKFTIQKTTGKERKIKI